MPNVPHRAVAETAEGKRLAEADLDAATGGRDWRQFGPYLSDRQWGTVREDYSADGDAWNYLPHDHARSRAYRWGEDAIAGFGDSRLAICMGLALWNGADPILKERLFGLTNAQGNHGEDVKELYYYLDALPSHAYNRMLYKYSQAAYPYEDLVAVNARRGLQDREYELQDTGLFDEGRYFDVGVEYAKADPDDILMLVTIDNRGDNPAVLHCLPQVWSRNTWTWKTASPNRAMRRRATRRSRSSRLVRCRRCGSIVTGRRLFCFARTRPTRNAFTAAARAITRTASTRSSLEAKRMPSIRRGSARRWPRIMC